MSKPVGRVLVVGAAACRAHVRAALARLPMELASADDPYAAALELCRRPLAYRAVVLCLNSVYKEEIAVVSLIKQRLGHIDVYLSQTDGRQAATVDAMRRGADGLLGEDGLHRFGDMPPQSEPAATSSQTPAAASPQLARDLTQLDEPPPDEPVLTNEELRALLAEHPTIPSAGQES